MDSSVPHLRVVSLSGTIVYDAPRPRGLAELSLVVAANMDANSAELVFCRGEAILECIEDAGEEITVVRDRVMALCAEFIMHASADQLPEHLRPAQEHKRLLLVAVRCWGRALKHASSALRADRDIVLAAVARTGCALQYASSELRADRDVVLAAVARDGHALQYASPELRANRDVVLAAVAKTGLALRYAAFEMRADRDVVLAAVVRNGHALRYASPELRVDRDVKLAFVVRIACRHAATILQNN